MHWVPGVDRAVMKEAIRQAGYDHRISKYTVEGYVKTTIPNLIAGGQVKQAFDPSPFIDPQFYLYAEKTFPQFYADLPKIPTASGSDPEGRLARTRARAWPRRR